MRERTYWLGRLGAVVILMVAAEANAQDVRLPHVGRQFLTAGLQLEPGILHDPGAEGREAPARNALNLTGQVVLGLHHIQSTQFYMSGELGLGLGYFDAHGAAPDGTGEQDLAFAWQAGLVGRWLPWEDQAGWTVGLGAHLYRAFLDEAPLNALAFEPRLGRYVWRDDDHFVLLEAGYAFSFIQGLSLPSPFTREEDAPPYVARSWTFHRWSLGLQVSL